LLDEQKPEAPGDVDAEGPTAARVAQCLENRLVTLMSSAPDERTPLDAVPEGNAGDSLATNEVTTAFRGTSPLSPYIALLILIAAGTGLLATFKWPVRDRRTNAQPRSDEN